MNCKKLSTDRGEKTAISDGGVHGVHRWPPSSPTVEGGPEDAASQAEEGDGAKVTPNAQDDDSSGAHRWPPTRVSKGDEPHASDAEEGFTSVYAQHTSATSTRGKSAAPAKPAESWMDSYAQLARYRDHHGTSSVEPVVNTADDPERHRLYWWADVQRKLQSMQLLEKDRVKLLDDLDFEWDPVPKRKTRTASLKRERSEMKRSLAQLQLLREDEVDFGVTADMARGTETEETPQRVPPPRFMVRFEHLKRFAEENGHCRIVCPPTFEDDPELTRTYNWLESLQKQHSKGTLREERARLLESLPGFVWTEKEMKRKTEEEGVIKKVGRRRRAGTIKESSEEEKACMRARLSEAEKLDPPERMPPPIWMARFESLKKFGEMYGHFSVPRPPGGKSAPTEHIDPEFARLFSWLKSVRRQYARGSLRDERIQLLERIGFEWNEKEKAGRLAALEKDGQRMSKVSDAQSPAKKKKRARSPSPPKRMTRSRRGRLEKITAEGKAAGAEKISRALRGKLQQEKRQKNQFGNERDHIEDKMAEKRDSAERKVYMPPPRWIARYEQLKRYREAHGENPPPPGKAANSPGAGAELELRRLYNWVSAQKKQLAEGSLREKQRELLEDIGFMSPRRLGRQKKASLTKEEEGSEDISEEEGIGNESPSRWMIRFEQLKRYRDQHGDFQVPRRFNKVTDVLAAHADPELLPLSNWLASVREQHLRGTLPKERRKLLVDIGFDFSETTAEDGLSEDKKKLYVPPPRWIERFEQLRAWHAEHGTFSTTRPLILDSEADQKNAKLHEWVRSIRKQDARGSLRKEKRELLEGIGFVFDKPSLVTATWARKIDELRVYKSVHGHVRVTSTRQDKEENTDLYRLHSWVLRQRKLRRAREVPEERIAQLDELGFEWGNAKKQKSSFLFEVDWSDMFQKLRAYYMQHGNVSIPSGSISRQDDPEMYELQRFVLQQRAHYKKGSLSEEQIEQLDSLDFDWTPMKTRKEGLWESHFHRLELYQIEHGNCRVPDKWPEDKKLAGFVSRMRYLWRLEGEGRLPKKDQNVLTPERKARLLGIGFEVSIHPSRSKKSWDDRFEQLREFFECHGHCDLPCRYNKVLLLPRWVKEQRKQYRLLFFPQEGKTSTLTMEQHRKLEDLGFDFIGARVGERCAQRWHHCTCDYDDGTTAAEEQASD